MTTPPPPPPDSPDPAQPESAVPPPPPPPPPAAPETDAVAASVPADDAPAADAPPVPPVPPTAPPQYPVAAPPVGYAPDIPRYPNGKPMLDEQGRPASPKSRLAAAVLAWFFGWLGIHRFYVGKIGTGVLMIFTLGGLGIWMLIDFIWILVGTFTDKEGRVLSNW